MSACPPTHTPCRSTGARKSIPMRRSPHLLEMFLLPVRGAVVAPRDGTFHTPGMPLRALGLVGASAGRARSRATACSIDSMTPSPWVAGSRRSPG